MRPIEFRVWNNIEMSECIDLPCKCLNDPAYNIMQFTGLLDKNGKEIYEGDIIQFYTEEHRPKPCEVIIQMPYGVRVKFADGWHYDWCRINGSWNHCEVIGNIYENPDLLR